MRALICFFVLLCVSVCYTNAQASDFGPLLDTDLIVHGIDGGSGAPGDSHNWPADIVFNNEQYFIVWSGKEGLSTSCTGQFPCSDIFGRLVSPSGENITELLEISFKRGTAQLWPAVASNGTTFLVVWVDYNPDPSTSSLVTGQLVTHTGDLLGREIIISNNTSRNWGADGYDVASDGKDYLVVWSNGSAIFGQKIKGNGTLDGSPFGIETSGVVNDTPSIIYGAGKYFVMWERHVDLGCWACDIDLNGAIIDIASGAIQSFPVATGESSQSSRFSTSASRPGGMSFDGTNFIVVWRDGRDWGVHARRISPEGVLLDGDAVSPGIILATSLSQQDGENPQISFDGSNWLAIWPFGNYGGINGIRIAPDGTILDSNPLTFITDYHVSFPIVASDGTNSMLEWDYNNQVKAQLVGSGVPRASAIIPFINQVGTPVAMDAKYSFSPSGAPLTYHWNFGDGAVVPPTNESTISHTYNVSKSYLVSLYVNDGSQQSTPFLKTTTVSSTSGGGQQAEVNDFLTFIAPSETSTALPAGTTSYDIQIVYGATIDPYSFQATLNGEPFNNFHPVKGTVENVTIPLLPGRNTLKVSVEGIKLPSQIAKDQDSLIFVVK